MPLPYRWLTSCVCRYNGSSLMIDCGEGTQIALKEKGWSFKPIDVICFTHFHGDHIGGLPGFLLTMGNADRTEPLTIVGPKGVEQIVRSLCVIAHDLPFELRFVELTEREVDLNIAGYQIHAFQVKHRITCYGYRISIPRAGKFDVERAKANDIPLRAWNPLQKGETVTLDGRTYTPDMVLGPPRKGLVMTYCTDTRPTQLIEENARGADLFICEGMYGEPDKEEKAREYKHMTFYEAATIGRNADVKEMWLTHYSPSLNRPDDYREAVQKVFPRCKTARDGWTRELKFDDEK